MSQSVLLSTNLSAEPKQVVPLTWQGKNDLLLQPDLFDQQIAFPVSSKLLTPPFIRKHVLDKTKKALFLDLKQPNSELYAIYSTEGIHIFDKTSQIWLTFI